MEMSNIAVNVGNDPKSPKDEGGVKREIGCSVMSVEYDNRASRSVVCVIMQGCVGPRRGYGYVDCVKCMRESNIECGVVVQCCGCLV